MTKDQRPYHHGDLANALLDAAEKELAEKGVEAFSLRGCAKRAGVSHAAPAHHFGDARGLLTALAARGYERLTLALAEGEESSTGNARDRFAGMGLGYVRFALENPAVFRLMFSSDRPDFDNPLLYGPAEAAFGALVLGVAATRDSQPLETGAGRRDVAAAWAMVHGIANLLIDERMKFLADDLSGPERDAILTDIFSRSLP